MNPRNPPLSPVSVGGSDFSASGYNERTSSSGAGGPREPFSPPSSGSFSNNGNMNGFSPAPKSVGGPSPPPSIAARTSYARSESGRSVMGDNTEAVLGEHYFALKRFLAATSKDGRAGPPPNKARDKLLRLSSVQFLELSTDVYDELLRRQAAEAFRRRPPSAPQSVGPPSYLLPDDAFHPKRNQARQKLSTLGPPRFRDLATDVFCELERRIPRVIAGEMPRPGTGRGPPSRAGTPVNGMGPRGPMGSMRRPSDASSIRSAATGPRMNGDYPVPPSPGMQNGNFDRPQPKQFQSNTIVPNKSTMIEEDDDVVGSNDDDNEAFGMDHAATNRESKRSATEASETDKKLIDDYQAQVRELREKLDGMEDQMKKKEDQMNSMLNEERSKATATDSEKKEWEDLRMSLENKVAEAQNLNDSMRGELDRLRDDYDKMTNDHAMEMRRLQEEIEDARQNSGAPPAAPRDSDLMRENEQLRRVLEEQQRVTEEARHEARQFLQEMKVLSEQHSPAWERQAELEKTVEKLEQEVRDWRNRYARTKTQLRDLRASSMSLSIDKDVARYIREKGFLDDNGLVKDVHVTKFQISVDELLQRARIDDPDKVIDSMKMVVMNVRRITKDIDGSPQHDEELTQQQQKLKGRVSATANNLITASKNFAASAGISPVSLLDAAASHLVAALVELLRTVKIRPTPDGELEEDEDGMVTPVDSAPFFSNRTTQNEGYGKQQDSPLAPPPTFQGLRGDRDSAQSSAYSSSGSPRHSANQYNNGAVVNGNGGMDYKNQPPVTNGYRQDTSMEDLIIYLSNQKDDVVQTAQGIVNLVRGGDASTIDQITDVIGSIAQVVDRVVSEMVSEPSRNANVDQMVERLTACRERLLEAGDSGRGIAASLEGAQTEEEETNSMRQWRMWSQTLPPITFKIVHEMDELIKVLGGPIGAGLPGRPGGDDFS